MPRYATERPSALSERLGTTNPAQAAQTTSIAEVKTNALVTTLMDEKFVRQLAMALPSQLDAKRFARVVLTECRKNPALLECTKQSFFGAVLQSAQLGLDPSSGLGHAYLVPYKNSRQGTRECQLLIGYRGMIDLARRSGQIKSLSAFAVYEEDDFRYELGLHPDIHHVPSSKADKGAIVYVYAVAVLKDGGVQFEVMSRAEIDAVRNASQGWVAFKKGWAKSCIWQDHYEEMAKKTAIRRLFKYLPVSVEAQRAVFADEKAERGESVTEKDVIDGIFADKGVEVEETAPDEAPVEEAEEVTGESLAMKEMASAQAAEDPDADIPL